MSNQPRKIIEKVIPEAHRYVCGRCAKPVHPWEDRCYFCGTGINWSEDLKRKYPEPDLWSKTIERSTSYARWKETRARK